MTLAHPLAAMEGLPLSGDGQPQFPEPWCATVFGLTVALYDRGLFTWDEWAGHLGRHLHAPGRRADAADYYDGWLDALCDLLTEKGIADTAAIAALAGRWQRAAEATPHGTPILLENADLPPVDHDHHHHHHDDDDHHHHDHGHEEGHG